jgi:translin
VSSSQNATSLHQTTAEIIARFDVLSSIRDRALAEGRQVIRLSANSVRAVHRHDFAEAETLLAEAKVLLSALTTDLVDYPNLYWAGYVQDAMKEFAEAQITFAIVGQTTIPNPRDLSVEDAPYLNAMAESASELRRDVLDRLRADDLDRAEQLLAAMDEIYDVLITVDFPDAITGGLRRTTDQLRAVLERTRGDLTITITQKRLQRSLNDTRIALGGTTGDDAEQITLPDHLQESES